MNACRTTAFLLLFRRRRFESREFGEDGVPRFCPMRLVVRVPFAGTSRNDESAVDERRRNAFRVLHHRADCRLVRVEHRVIVEALASHRGERHGKVTQLQVPSSTGRKCAC